MELRKHIDKVVNGIFMPGTVVNCIDPKSDCYGWLGASLYCRNYTILETSAWAVKLKEHPYSWFASSRFVKI